jgi:hypothetical protein
MLEASYSDSDSIALALTELDFSAVSMYEPTMAAAIKNAVVLY